MSPPNSPHRPGQGALALTPGFKVFLAGSILFLGTMSALPFLLERDSTAIPPSSETRTGTVSLSVDGVPPIAVSEQSLASTTAAAPAFAEHSKKVVQRVSTPQLLPTEQQTSDAAVESAVQPIAVRVREFASIHSPSQSTTTPPERKSIVFDKKPEKINPSKIADALLPMFHFAENLKPLTNEKGNQSPPENPFRLQSVGETAPSGENKLLPLRPFLELRPLRLPER